MPEWWRFGGHREYAFHPLVRRGGVDNLQAAEGKVVKTVWTTKSGQTMRFRDMEDSHLLNAIRMLRRNYQRQMLHEALVCDNAYPDGEPDGAAMAAQSEANYAFEEADEQQDIEQHLPIFGGLLKELERRKLEELPI